MFASKDTLLTRPSGYNIARSVRIRGSASAYFSKTYGTSPTSRTTMTMSAWVKRGKPSDGTNYQTIFGTGSNYENVTFNTDDTIRFTGPYSSAQQGVYVTTQKFRDYSAWYHIVVVYDTTNATATNRMRLYVNGVQVTAFSTQTTSNQNNTTSEWLVSGGVSAIGQTGSANYFDGYLTEINVIDGQALTPSSFGETDSITGVWKPKAYSGTYGTNGFELNFSDNSNNTAATIGKDYSGNGNNWTPTNISVTSGVTYDSMVDSPTVGATSSNYAVLNPVNPTANTPSDGNLRGVMGSSENGIASTMAIPSGMSAYWEVSSASTTSASIGCYAGVASLGVSMAQSASYNKTGVWAMIAVNIRQLYANGSAGSSVASTLASTSILQVAVDNTSSGSNTYIWIGVDNVFYNSTMGTTGNPSTGANPTFTISKQDLNAFFSGYLDTVYANFGQRPFSYTPPTGYVALNTYNLPASTITNGAAYMAATTWTSVGGTETITNTVNGIGFQPDFVWMKNRTISQNNYLVDSNRGSSKILVSNTTSAEVTDATFLTSFNSNGFSLGSGGFAASQALVGWQWKKGASSGFDVVSQTLATTGINTITHSLNAVPTMVLAKKTSAGAEQWLVYQSSGTTQSQYLGLNTTAAVATSGNLWGSSAFTSSQIYFNGTSGNTYVFYIFAPVAGYSAFGSYTGNGSTDGTFVYLGFKPRWVMIKCSSTGGTGFDWYIFDSSRQTYNAIGNILMADLPDAEFSVTNLDFTSNGFKMRTSSTALNGSGSTYIYMAFAENPFRNALARQETIMFKHNNQTIPLDTPFTIDGTSYPANWLRLTSLAEKQAVGIEEVADVTTTYDDRFFWSVDNPKLLNDREESDEDGNPMYVKVLGVVDGEPAMVDSTERLVTKGLKSNWTAQVKDTANKLLAQTDWMVIRKAERDVAIPTATATYRAAVITECSRLVTAIAGASDVEAFIAVVTAQGWPDAS